MRLSDWMAAAPHKDSGTPKVMAVVEPVIAMLGGGVDPHGWVAWGEDPGMRYTIFVATDAGLLQVIVRVNVPGEGPRSGGKLIRWNRVQLGDLAVEMQGGHRILSVPLEGQILRGTDETADLVAAFVLDCLAAIDGRAREATAGKAGGGKGAKREPKVVPLGPSEASGASSETPVPARRAVPQLEAPKGSSS